jgi:hypothetical protein
MVAPPSYPISRIWKKFYVNLIAAIVTNTLQFTSSQPDIFGYSRIIYIFHPDYETHFLER